jgi:hypothetical protein
MRKTTPVFSLYIKWAGIVAAVGDRQASEQAADFREWLGKTEIKNKSSDCHAAQQDWVRICRI